MGMLQDSNCELCGMTTETLDHVMFKCRHAGITWTSMMQWMQMNDTKDIDLQWIKRYTHNKGWKHGLFKAVAAETLYGIWPQKNKFIFEKDTYTLDATRITKSIMDAIAYRGWMHPHYRSKLVMLLI